MRIMNKQDIATIGVALGDIINLTTFKYFKQNHISGYPITHLSYISCWKKKEKT